jgi:exodeoxyribonuclease VII large subunit
MAAERLHARAASLLDQRRAALQQRAGLLRTLGPDSVLSRGFTCTLDATGRVVRDATALQPGDSFQTRFRRGRITGTVVSVDPDAPHAKS